MNEKAELFAARLIDFWRKWYDGESVGDCLEWIELSSLSKDRPAEALELIATVVRRDPDGLTFECLSGCVTDMLRSNASVVLDQLEREAKANPLFSQMLGEIPPSHVPDECRQLLSQISTPNTTASSTRVEAKVVGKGKLVVLLGERKSWIVSIRDVCVGVVRRLLDRLQR